MEVILPALYRANVGALGLEFANPRHQHEMRRCAKHRLPDHMLLIPGVIDCTTQLRRASARWSRNASTRWSPPSAIASASIAGVDCGFGTFVGWEWVTEDVVWAKLKTLRAGAGPRLGAVMGKAALTLVSRASAGECSKRTNVCVRHSQIGIGAG